MPWTHLRGPFLRSTWTDLTSEWWHFNVVICLHKVKQPGRTVLINLFYDVPLLLSSLRTSTLLQLCSSEAERSSWKQCFLQEEERQPMLDHYVSGWGCMLSGVVFFLLMDSWRGQTCRAPNSLELDQLFTAHVAWTTTVPSRGITHDSLGLNWIYWIPCNYITCLTFLLFHSSSSTSPPFGP